MGREGPQEWPVCKVQGVEEPDQEEVHIDQELAVLMVPGSVVAT